MRPVWLGEWLAGQIEPNGKTPLQQQLLQALRQAILDGRLEAGVRLPSTRTLASELKLARNTLIAAFDQLQAEGCIETRAGVGCFVAKVSDSSPITAAKPSTKRRAAESLPISQRCREWLTTTNVPPMRPSGAFVPAVPDLRAFPFHEWWQLVHKHQRALPWQRLEYGGGGGLATLKTALSAHLRIARAVHCEPEQIIITSSAQATLDLCCRVLADVGEGFAIEDPGYLGARASAIAAGLRPLPITVDNHGLVVDALPQSPPKLIYVTPSNQFPNGVVMSLPRRRALLAYAEQRGSYILEDDYDSEIRFESKPQASLQGLDQHDRVLYLGTFAKIFYPALRLAYMVVPQALVEIFARSQNRLQRAADLTYQAAMAEFISSGKLAAHIRKMRLLYAERNQYLQALLSPHLKNKWRLSGGKAGLHIVLLAQRPFDDVSFAEQAGAHGITVWPLSSFYYGAAKRYGLILGYATADKRELKRGYSVLKALLHW